MCESDRREAGHDGQGVNDSFNDNQALKPSKLRSDERNDQFFNVMAFAAATSRKKLLRVSLTFTILRHGETWLVNG